MKPEHRAEAIRLGIEHSTPSRAEPGSLAHDCHVDAEDEARLVFVEEWADMAAVRTRFAVADSGALVRELAGMGERVPWMRIYEASEVEQ